MAEEPKATRLSKAAREFNVGISTIVDYLHKKGYDIDPNPNSKVTADAYELLLKEYSSDLNVKKESDKLIQKEIARKQEAISLEKEKEEASVVEVVTAPAEVKTEKASPDVAPVDKIEKTDTKEKSPVKTIAAEPEKEEEIAPEKESSKSEAGMKVNVVGKIDLESLKKPKKAAAVKKEEEKKEKILFHFRSWL